MADRQTLSPPELAAMIDRATKIVALTGAGISTAAGIPDFRGPQGLYVTRRYDPETVFDISYFRRDPRPFYDFTRDFLDSIHTIDPTTSHRFLADLEERGKLETVVTQNIDSLHQKAGSIAVIPVHGDYWISRCLECDREYDLEFMEAAIQREEVPHCECQGVIKPDVVFFGEAVKGLDRASAAIVQSDLLLILGSALAVYPVAMLPEVAGGDVVVVNMGEVNLSPGPRRFFVDQDLEVYFSSVWEQLTKG